MQQTAIFIIQLYFIKVMGYPLNNFTSACDNCLHMTSPLQSTWIVCMSKITFQLTFKYLFLFRALQKIKHIFNIH